MDIAYKKTLELDKVLARAVQLCACRETKEMMQDLQPCVADFIRMGIRSAILISL